MFDLCLAIGHHLLIFILFSVLVAELVLVRSGLGQKTIALIGAAFGEPPIAKCPHLFFEARSLKGSA